MAITTDLTSLWKLQANGDDHIGPYNPQAITGVTFVTDSSKQVADFSSGQIRYDPNTIDGISTNFTIACWLKVDTIQDSIILTNAYSGSTFPSLQLSVRPGGAIRFQFYTSNGAGGANTVETPSAISASTWYHFVFSYDGSTMTIYQDGSSVATQSAGGSPFTNGFSISVGSYRPYSSGLFLDGRMSDLALWYRAITSTEVSSIYGAGLANFSSLLPDVKLRGQFGSVVHDSPALLMLEGQFGSVVHDSPALLMLEGQFGSVVHSGAAPPPSSGSAIQGASSQGSSPQGDNVQGNE